MFRIQSFQHRIQHPASSYLSLTFSGYLHDDSLFLFPGLFRSKLPPDGIGPLPHVDQPPLRPYSVLVMSLRIKTPAVVDQ